MTVSYSGGVVDGATPSGLSGLRRRRRDERDRARYASYIARRFRWAAQGCIGEVCSSAAGVPGLATPTVWHVDLDEPVTLHLRLLAGQLPSDIAAAGYRLAESIGVAAIRVKPDGQGYAKVQLLRSDPLAAPATNVAPDALIPVTFGLDEYADPVTGDLSTAAHLIIQGATGSGKSMFAYGLLSQLAAAPYVTVTGSDVTGLLLGPWVDHATAGIPVLGTRQADAHVHLLERVVSEMDRRITWIPAGHDSVPIGPECPLLVVVIEEYPGLLRLLDAIDPKGFAKTARACVARLLGEGRKAGIRLVMIAQRAEANIIGGYERGQASHKISFRVDTADAVRMLHPQAAPEVIADHATAEPGIGLLSAPGQPLTRFRGPYLPYADYCKAVANEAP